MSRPYPFRNGDRFPVLDLLAMFDFETANSVSFELGNDGDLPFFEDGELVHIVSDVSNVIGWVDVHYPCEGHIKVRLRASVPEPYLETEKMFEFVRQVFVALRILEDETYEASFFSAAQQASIENATDRDGKSDRVY